MVASPFVVNKAYAELIFNRTSSPRLSKVLRKWNEERWDAPEPRQKLAWVLLVELLSYQFASSVRRIETQDLFFKQYKFEHFITKITAPKVLYGLMGDGTDIWVRELSRRTLGQSYVPATVSVSYQLAR